MKKSLTIKESIIVGILYDVTYTNTVILNAIIFFLISFIAIKFNKRLNKNLPNLIFTNIAIIFIYLTLTYLILVLYQYLSFNAIYFVISILKSLIINTIYVIILYLILRHKKIKFT